MKFFFIAFTLLALPASPATAQGEATVPDRDGLTEFILEYCRYRDPNPTHQEEADKVNAFLAEVLTTPDRQDNDSLRRAALDLYWENSVSMLEDVVDGRRYAERRYMCCLTMALLADYWRYGAFLGDAENCIRWESDEINEEYARQRAVIPLVELLIVMDGQWPHHTEWLMKSLRGSASETVAGIENRDFGAAYLKLFGI